MSAYQEIKNRLDEIANLGKASELLEWDMEVMMPSHGGEERGKILGTLSAIAHQKQVEPVWPGLIEKALAEANTPTDKRNLMMIDQNYKLATQVPEKLVSAIEEARSKTVLIWEKSKATSDWKAVVPSLKNLFSLTKERATIHGEILGCSAYDSQLFRYARGNTQAKIDPLFDMLKQELPPLAKEIMEKQKSFQVKDYKISEELQKKIAVDLIQKLGFDLNRGRLDEAAHPFSGGTPNDSRITNRYDETMPFEGLYGAIHETGHALYTQHLPAEWENQPVGRDTDMSLHESQSLIMEKQAGMNTHFLDYLYKLIASYDPEFSAVYTT